MCHPHPTHLSSGRLPTDLSHVSSVKLGRQPKRGDDCPWFRQSTSSPETRCAPPCLGAGTLRSPETRCLRDGSSTRGVSEVHRAARIGSAFDARRRYTASVGHLDCRDAFPDGFTGNVVCLGPRLRPPSTDSPETRCPPESETSPDTLFSPSVDPLTGNQVWFPTRSGVSGTDPPCSATTVHRKRGACSRPSRRRSRMRMGVRQPESVHRKRGACSRPSRRRSRVRMGVRQTESVHRKRGVVNGATRGVSVSHSTSASHSTDESAVTTWVAEAVSVRSELASTTSTAHSSRTEGTPSKTCSGTSGIGSGRYAFARISATPS